MSLWEKLRGKLASPQSVGVSQAAVDRASSPRKGATVLRAPAAAVAANVAASLAQDADHKIAGTFPVKKVLGSGSMGTVYLVQHPSWNTEVALKVPTAELIADAENRHRITVEAEAWTELGLHPHIAYCYYVQTLNDVLLMVVEYVDGGNLAEWIGKHGQNAELKTKLDLAIQFCHALEHAHGKGLIHRDIKPSNVLLTKEWQLKLTDFGIARVGAGPGAARALVPGASVDGTMVGIGTEEYMPPEQWVSAQVDVRADLFAFGVCLYELFCGRRPYVGRLIGQTQAPLDPMGFNASLPQALGGLLRECVIWNKERRPASAQAIRQRLCAIYEAVLGAPSQYGELPRFALHGAALNNRALSYVELGKLERAERAWEEALRADPTQFEATYNYALHRWRTGRIGDDGAVRELQAVAASAPSARLFRYLHAGLAAEAGDRDTARRLLTELAIDEAGDGTAPRPDEVSAALSTLDPGNDVTLVLEGHTDRVRSLAVSGDGRYALTGGDAGIGVWDLNTGQCLRTLGGHKKHVTSVSLTIDGRLGVSGSADCTIKVWDCSRGRCVRTIERGGSVCAVSIDAQGQVILSARLSMSRDFLERQIKAERLALPQSLLNTVLSNLKHPIELWDAKTGELLHEFKGHAEPVSCLAMSGDGRLAVSGSYDGTIMIWNLQARAPIAALRGHTMSVTDIAITPDGRFALSSSRDRSLRLWDLSSRKCAHILRGHTDDPYAVSLSADGRHAISAQYGRTKIWELSTGRCLRTLSASPPVCISADGRYAWHSPWHSQGQHSFGQCAVPSGKAGAAWLPCRVVSSTQQVDMGAAHLLAADRAHDALARGEERVALRQLQQLRAGPLARDGRVFPLWQRLYRRFPRTELKGLWKTDLTTAAATSICLTGDGRFAVSAQADGAFIWDLASCEMIRSVRDAGQWVRRVRRTGDGTRLLIHGQDTFGSWDSTGERNQSRASAPKSLYPPVSFNVSPDGKLALWTGGAGISLWNLETCKLLRNYDCSGDVGCFTADGHYAVIASEKLSNTQIFMIDLATGDIVHRFGYQSGKVRALSATADGRQLLSASDDGTLVSWPLMAGGRETKLGKVRPGWGTACVAVDDSGRYAISGTSAEGSLWLWDLATGDHVATLAGHVSDVEDVALTPDGRLAVSCAADGVKVWTFDWELEDTEQADWDDRARPYLQVFLRAHVPYGGAFGSAASDDEKAAKELSRALARRGRPAWNEADFRRLLDRLACAGYGCLHAAGVRRELVRLAADPDFAMTGWSKEGLPIDDRSASVADADPPPTGKGSRVGRNDPCPCGSNLPYKRCHGRLQ